MCRNWPPRRHNTLSILLAKVSSNVGMDLLIKRPDLAPEARKLGFTVRFFIFVEPPFGYAVETCKRNQDRFRYPLNCDEQNTTVAKIKNSRYQNETSLENC